MSINSSISDFVGTFLQELSTDYSIPYKSDTTTENYPPNITEIFTDNAFFDSQKNGNVVYHNMTEKIQNHNTTEHGTYPPGILWFGAICCILFSILGTTGNFISILALVRCKKLRNATTAFVVNLCAADFVYCAITMPMVALLLIDRDRNHGDVTCKRFGLIGFSNGMLSIFSLVAIAVNRYVLIAHPRIYRTVYSPRIIAIIIASLWIFPFILVALPLFGVWGTLEYEPRIGNCSINDLNGKSPRTLILFLLLVLPSICFIGCYLRIYFVVKKSARNVRKQDEHRVAKNTEQISMENNFKNTDVYVDLKDKKEFRLLRICLVIFIFYFVTTVPLILMKVLRIEGKLPILSVMAYVIHYFTSVINPVIYIAMSMEYRQAYKDLFTTKMC